jgi:hypothetical protein
MMASLVPALLLAAPLNDADPQDALVTKAAKEVASTCAACQIVNLDFMKIQGVSHDTLKKSDGEMRWIGIGEYEGKSIDLVMTKTLNAKNTCWSGNDVACTYEGARYFGGVNVGRGPLNVLRGTFTLRYTHTNNKAVSEGKLRCSTTRPSVAASRTDRITPCVR